LSSPKPCAIYFSRDPFVERSHANAGASSVDEEKSMRRLFTIVSFGLLFCSALLSFSPAQIPSGPSMVLPERYFDFKEVEEGKVFEHAFKVLNKGNQPLEIKNVNPG